MATMDDKVTVREAYLAMFEYLRRYHERGASDETGALLGELSLLPDDQSADPAAWADFLSSMETVRKAEAEGGYEAAGFRLS